MRDVVAEAFGALIAGGAVRRDLDRGGRVLRWIEAGTGGPTVVCEPGAGSTAVTWAAVVAALVPDVRVIAYDRAGYDASDPAPLGLDGQLGDLLAVLGSAGPCVVVGHSWVACWHRSRRGNGRISSPGSSSSTRPTRHCG